MVEVTLQLSAPISDSIKKIADKEFEGNLTAVINAAIRLYLGPQELKRNELKEAVQQIRREVDTRGGIDEQVLEQRIRDYRSTKYPSRQ